MAVSFLVTKARQKPNMETKSQEDILINISLGHDQRWRSSFEVDMVVINEVDKMDKTLNEDNIFRF